MLRRRPLSECSMIRRQVVIVLILTSMYLVWNRYKVVAHCWWFRTGFRCIMCRYSTVSKSRTVSMSIILQGFENEGFVIWVFWFWMRIQGNHVIAVQNIGDKIKKEREKKSNVYILRLHCRSYVTILSVNERSLFIIVLLTSFNNGAC